MLGRLLEIVALLLSFHCFGESRNASLQPQLSTTAATCWISTSGGCETNASLSGTTPWDACVRYTAAQGCGTQSLAYCADHIVPWGDGLHYDCYVRYPNQTGSFFGNGVTKRCSANFVGSLTFRGVTYNDDSSCYQVSNQYTCDAVGGWELRGAYCVRSDAPKNQGDPQCLSEGNPINRGTGVKYESEDLTSGGGDIRYSISYNSRAADNPYSKAPGAWGIFRTGSYLESLVLSFGSGNPQGLPGGVYALRSDGKVLQFALSGNNYISDADRSERLTRIVDTNGRTTGWLLSTASGGNETYDASGRHLVDIDSLGRTLSLDYDGQNRLATVTDTFGRKLTFAYDVANRINNLTQPDGGIVTFSYDTADNLHTVTWPGNLTRTYHYEDSRFPNNLTGITDENGVRFATWSYDAQGRAIVSKHAGEVDTYQLTYNTTNTVVIDPLLTQRTKNLTTILGVVKSTGESQPGGSGCGPSSSSVTYDTSGNVKTRTDFNGNLTEYSYDSGGRNLEIQRVEAKGKSEQRSISTQWHSYWRKPTKIAEPKKLTTYVYNGDNGVYCAPASATVASINGGVQPIGVLCAQTEQATTDADGSAGLSPSVTGMPRVWNWTYNQYGQVLTADGPRTDVADVTRYTYYDLADPDAAKRGKLASVTNALGHVTQYTAYDLNGRPLTVLDPNSQTIAYTYWPRGWLKTVTRAGKTTSYDYDGVGQLTKIVRPDGGYIEYDYDDAHRLRGIIDSRGDSLVYQRDNAGNVTRSDWKNPDSSIVRSQRFAYDALGRLQNVVEMRNGADVHTVLGYDPNGNRTIDTSFKQQTATTEYDGLDRPVRMTDRRSGITQLTYDGRGQLTQLRAPNQAVTNYSVDGLGNSQETSPDRGNLTATYDAAGNLLTLADGRNVVETHTWDALNRPLTVSYPAAGENVTYTWDRGNGSECSNGIGRLCLVSDNGGSTRFAYDPRGNLIRETRSEGGVTLAATQYAYDDADRVVTAILPTGKILTTPRDADGRVMQVTATSDGIPKVLVDNIQTDALGRVTAQTLGNGATQTRTYNPDGTLARQADTPAKMPWFNSLGPQFDYAALVAAVPEIAWQGFAWHAVADDVDHDGDLDLFLYFNSANENFMELSCFSDCASGYGGPNFGTLVFLENVGGTYVRRPFNNREDIVRGDVAQMVPLDFNNDGKTDFLLVLDDVSSLTHNPAYLSNKPYRRLVLLKNDSGAAYAAPGNPGGTHFTDVTVTVGLDKAAWYAEGLVLDLNQDGYPDILGTSRTADYTILGDAFVFSPATGTYQVVSTSGLPRPLWVPALADLDSDGKIDVVAQDYTAGLRFFRNNGNGSFTEWVSTQDLSRLGGRWWASMVPADMDNDGLMDLVTFESDFVGAYPNWDYAGGKIRWLRNTGVAAGQISFVEQTASSFESDGNDRETAYGGTVGDVNNDGFLDIVMVTNEGGSRLVVADGLGGYQRLESSGEMLGGLRAPESRYAQPVLVDFNGDGKVDLLSTESRYVINSGNYLLHNTGRATGSRSGLSIELTGRVDGVAPTGKDAFGARVEVSTGGRTIRRQVLPIMGFSRRLHFGLGDAPGNIQIRIYWPGNPTPQVLTGDPYINAILRVSQP